MKAEVDNAPTVIFPARYRPSGNGLFAHFLGIDAGERNDFIKNKAFYKKMQLSIND
ncbi:MAG: hypothetical protein AB7E77_02365 [Desulfobulbus sp.]